VKRAGWKEPIGEIVDFYYNSKKYKVVGVVKDFQNASLMQELKPQLFNMNPQMNYGLLHVKIDPHKKTAALKHIEKTIKAAFPFKPYKYDFLDEMLSKQYENEEKWKQIISFSALLTIFISCIGLFGMAALSAEKRAKEMSIRKVLGASPGTLMASLSFDFLKLVMAAACISVPLAWWVIYKWLELYAHRISPGPSLFIFPVVTIVLLALLTTSYQAIRSAFSNPVNSLRTE
jgi:putative ABC transport system permease protein